MPIASSSPRTTRESRIRCAKKIEMSRPSRFFFYHIIPSLQTARVARNTQLILQEEAGICAVADPWGGSYMMESLTDELADKAMDIIDEVEAGGGMTAYINSGMAK